MYLRDWHSSRDRCEFIHCLLLTPCGEHDGGKRVAGYPQNLPSGFRE